ncbi:MAG: hypothetical protein HKN90_03240 [Flavobacteriaceae bacterium]|nr:hypothetical protein [Flavobacteriaceae bacterium]
MNKDRATSLQERIVNEITSTYNSIAEYKSHTLNSFSRNNNLDRTTAERRIELVEHKLKALKMILAKIDDGEYALCEKCHNPIAPKNKLLNRPKNRFCTKCS